MKRHENALGILEGARNVRAIARSLVQAADEAAGEGIGAEHDAAVRMIVHLLSRLCRTEEISYGFDAVTLTDNYCTLMHELKTRAGEGVAPLEAEPQVILLRPEPALLPDGPRG